MNISWKYILSPCVIAAAVILIGLIQSAATIKSSQGWNALGLIYGIPLLLLIIGIDAVIKLLVKKKIGLVWLIELILIAVVFFLFKEFVG